MFSAPSSISRNSLPSRAEIERELARRGASLAPRPLWPSPFDEDTAESAYQFVLGLHTWNEAEKAIQPFPDKPYLRELAEEWHSEKALGGTLIVEKCRRMVVSWLFRGLELHQMGLARGDQMLGGENYESAAKHVWRLEHYYTDLATRKPKWHLPPSKVGRYDGDRKLRTFTLTNGSTCTAVNGESASLQGDGVAIITMEEFSRYRYCGSMLAQAKIITKGSPGHPGGFVVAICNASVNEEWHRIKAGGHIG